MRARTGFLCIVLVLAMPAVASATAPANDDLADAIPVVSGEVFAGTNEDATVEMDEPIEPTCLTGVAEVGRTLWYAFDAPTEGDIVVEPIATDIAMAVTVYSGSTFETLVEVGCGPRRYVGDMRAPVVAGTSYVIQIGGYNGDPGSFEVVLRMEAGTPRPEDQEAADDLASARVVSPPYSTSGLHLTNATSEAEEDTLCDRGEASDFYGVTGTLWLLISSPSGGAITLDTTVPVATNVYRGTSYADLVPVLCQTWEDLYTGGPDRFFAAAGATYAVQLFSDASDYDAPFGLTVGGVYPRPANDDLVDATTIPELPFSDEVVMWGATTEPEEPVSPCTTMGQIRGSTVSYGYVRPAPTVWYRYVTDQARLVYIDTYESDFWNLIEIYVRDGDRWINVACDTNLILIGTQPRSFTAIPGLEYVIKIAGEEYIGGGSFSGSWLGTLKISLY